MMLGVGLLLAQQKVFLVAPHFEHFDRYSPGKTGDRARIFRDLARAVLRPGALLVDQPDRGKTHHADETDGGDLVGQPKLKANGPHETSVGLLKKSWRRSTGRMPAVAKTTADIANDCLKRPKTTQAAEFNPAAGTAHGRINGKANYKVSAPRMS